MWEVEQQQRQSWVWSLAFALSVQIASGTLDRLTIVVCFAQGFRRKCLLYERATPG